MIAKLNFQQPLLKSSFSHDPSEIKQICWFDVKETKLIKAENRSNIFMETDIFSEFFDE